MSLGEGPSQRPRQSVLGCLARAVSVSERAPHLVEPERLREEPHVDVARGPREVRVRVEVERRQLAPDGGEFGYQWGQGLLKFSGHQ